MKKQALTYKERQDVIWALEEFATELVKRDSVVANESAERLRLLSKQFESGER